MDKVKIFLEDGVEVEVNCIFYLYNSKYYFLYTLNELDENGYVRLYLVKVGKEAANSKNGQIETGNMIGIEVPTDEEWKEVQTSISKIVSSKKTKIEDKDIQYLPLTMLTNLKIASKKTFRLLSSIIENDFGVDISERLALTEEEKALKDPNMNKPIEENSTEIGDSQGDNNQEKEESIIEENISGENGAEEETTEIINSDDDTKEADSSESEISTDNVIEETDNNDVEEDNEDESEYDNSDVIIDYRTRFFEEQEKNKRLKAEIEKLNKKLQEIDEIIKRD